MLARSDPRCRRGHRDLLDLGSHVPDCATSSVGCVSAVLAEATALGSGGHAGAQLQ
jgi:hypothetical protein